jgi:hypothetical protein
MTEGRVYLCSWEKVGRRYRLWVTQKPKLVGDGRSFAAAREALWGVVCTALGDGEAIFEFDPPEPMAEVVRQLRDPAIVTIVGNTHSQVMGDLDSLFKNGVCPRCSRPRGPRTDVPLTVDFIESGYQGGFTWAGHFSFFSEEFLSILTRQERDRFEWRPVVRGQRAKKKFYELVAEPGIPWVGMRDLQYGPLWECDDCGERASPMYFPGHGQDQTLRDAGISRFVSRAALPEPLPTWLFFGGPVHYYLGVRQERWQELMRKRGARGLVSTPIGVLKPAQVARDLKYVKRSEVDQNASKMMGLFKKLIGQHKS